ncbi:CidA/LrgA family protein [Clostridium aestuarii]|uniref:CidA/LrgA family protein n=1 Tax=Clostridium aestuarii TaxID=338193 RepID=A0ABT4D0M2_9CLOT|nr:CidA/LrgA family protein [Clostridium aestuarii]MCY6484786.1 CidA/LrgA family protein [Clostridium aestuarii]
MKLLRQASIILIICFLGEIIHSTFNLPIPSSVLGMLILLACLCLGLIKLEMIENISNFLLDYLAFFFVPAGVSLISCFSLLRDKWLPILTISLISTVIIISVTGIIVQLIIIRRKNI